MTRARGGHRPAAGPTGSGAERADRLGPVRRVAGADVAYARGEDRLCAAVAVLGLDGLAVLEVARAGGGVPRPYRPGFLAAREAPAVLAALARLSRPPDVVLVEGHGLAHPARFGVACHVGVAADLPAVGVAKSLLVGRHGPVPEPRGAWVPVVHRGEAVGAAVRTRPGVRPVYVSIGHRVGLDTAVGLALLCGAGHRLPEPIRCAHREARLGLERR